MDRTASSCEFQPGQTRSVQGSRVLRALPGNRWEGIPVEDYKSPAAHWCGVTRMSLVGEMGESTAFHLRYFEIAPGGFSSHEHHRHEHVVIVMQGRGEVQLGGRLELLQPGDVVYVAPDEPHQFRNPQPTEPLGFFCLVDAVRDRPKLTTAP